MASKIQGRYLDEIRDKITKKWKNKCEAKYGVAEKMQNQNGVVFLSDLKIQSKLF